MPEKTDKELKNRWMQYEGFYRLRCMKEEKDPIIRKNATVQKETISQKKRHQSIDGNIHVKRLKTSNSSMTNNTMDCKYLNHATVQKPISIISHEIYFTGPVWDSENLTCAVDTAIASIQHLYFNMSENSRNLLMCLSPWIEEIWKTPHINTTRNHLLSALNILNADDFPMGPINKSLSEVVQAIFTSSPENSLTFHYVCDITNQHYVHSTNLDFLQIPYDYSDTQNLISTLIGPAFKCCYCNNYHTSIKFTVNPTVPILLIAHNTTVSNYQLLKTFCKDGRTYILQCILYFKNAHFTCCLFKDYHSFWYDGMKNHGKPTLLREDLDSVNFKGHTPVLLIYSLN